MCSESLMSSNPYLFPQQEVNFHLLKDRRFHTSFLNPNAKFIQSFLLDVRLGLHSTCFIGPVLQWNLSENHILVCSAPSLWWMEPWSMMQVGEGMTTRGVKKRKGEQGMRPQPGQGECAQTGEEPHQSKAMKARVKGWLLGGQYFLGTSGWKYRQWLLGHRTSTRWSSHF